MEYEIRSEIISGRVTPKELEKIDQAMETLFEQGVIRRKGHSAYMRYAALAYTDEVLQGTTARELEEKDDAIAKLSEKIKNFEQEKEENHKRYQRLQEAYITKKEEVENYNQLCTEMLAKMLESKQAAPQINPTAPPATDNESKDIRDLCYVMVKQNIENNPNISPELKRWAFNYWDKHLK